MMGITSFSMAPSKMLNPIHSGSLKSDFCCLDDAPVKEGRLVHFKSFPMLIYLFIYLLFLSHDKPDTAELLNCV